MRQLPICRELLLRIPGWFQDMWLRFIIYIVLRCFVARKANLIATL